MLLLFYAVVVYCAIYSNILYTITYYDITQHTYHIRHCILLLYSIHMIMIPS